MEAIFGAMKPSTIVIMMEFLDKSILSPDANLKQYSKSFNLAIERHRQGHKDCVFGKLKGA